MNPICPIQEFDALLRSDFQCFLQKVFQTLVPGNPYQDNWHIEAMCHSLDLCRRGVRRRQIITLPPRHLKSILCSVAWPAFLLGHNPGLRVICVSYSEELAAKHARDCRKILCSDWYQRIFPHMRISRSKNTEFEIETTRGGGRLATSTGGTLTGRGGGVIILDDPQKPQDTLSDVSRKRVQDWYGDTLLSRLDDKARSVVLLVMQRLHVDDLVGYVLSSDQDWAHLNLPAIAQGRQSIDLDGERIHLFREGDILHPAREPAEVLNALQREMGRYAFSAQYLQQPVPVEGNLVQWDWFLRYETLPVPHQKGMITQSWDTALGMGRQNDWSVCTTWLRYDSRHYLVDVYRKKLDFPSLMREVPAQAKRHHARRVMIEEAGSGKALIQQLKRETRTPGLIGIMPEGDKVSRLQSASHLIETGRVFLPQEAAWLAELQKELLAFPQSRHDDQVDSISQYLIDDFRPGRNPRIRSFA